MLQLNELGIELATLNHPRRLLAHLVGGADGEGAEHLNSGQLEGMGRGLVAGEGSTLYSLGH